jgi:hypothetical protein
MIVGLCVGAAILLGSANVQAQSSLTNLHVGAGDHADPMNKLSGKTAKVPYGGQIYCPVSGKKLGLKEKAVPVQTTIGESKPGRVAGFFGKKPSGGAVIYVCCPGCVEIVRSNPQQLLDQVKADKADLSSQYTYANAPEYRPVLAGDPKSAGVLPPTTIQPAALQTTTAPH